MVTTKERTVSLAVKANLIRSQASEPLPKTAVYAFSAGGSLLAHQRLDDKGSAQLLLPAVKEANAVRLLVGPEVAENQIQVAELLRRGAEERMLRLEPGNLQPTVDLAIFPDRWRCWLVGLTFVTGKLLKRVVNGGITIDLPVGHAEIEIYEVDPLHILIPKLPDSVIDRLRDIILQPIPFPRDPIGPVSSPAFALQGIHLAMVAQAPVPTLMNVRSQPVPDALPDLSSRVGSLQFLARTADLFQFRRGLLDHIDLIRPLICQFYPHFVTTQLVGTATTDGCGKFHSAFSRGCHNPDVPDLYFKAKQRVFPLLAPFTIYAPTPIACHTYWNYVSGTEVTLFTTSPFAITSAPCAPVIAPKHWVLLMAVGNTPLSQIRGASESLQPTTNATNIGLTGDGAPWGGLLRPRLEFDNSLRQELGVLYYQVSWRKGTSGPFQPLTGEVHRHYTHVVSGDLVLEVYPLGPKVVNGVANLFEIPPALPPIGQWSIPDAVENTTSAKFPTQDIAPVGQEGLYQLKVELFDGNGQAVNPAALGIKYRVPDVADLNGTITTDDAATLGLVSSGSLVLTLHVDNNPCTAAIAPPTLNGIAANDCGVLEYAEASPGSVTLAYTASHPHGFATYSFGLVRGATSLTPPSVSGPVGGGSFSTVQGVNGLLSATCPIAGFSENLYVAATAIDGWQRLSGYDRSAVRAFVLAPPMTSNR